MNINELNKEELQEVTELYIKERDTMTWLCSFEEEWEWKYDSRYHWKSYKNSLTNSVKEAHTASYFSGGKCESCGELVLVDDCDCELPIAKNYRGNEYHCCEICYEEMR